VHPADQRPRPTIRVVTAPLPDLVLYGRPGCHLCEDARIALEAILADRAGRGLAAPPITERSIEGDDDLQRRYALTIPVVTLGDRELELATSPAKLRRLLEDVLDATPTAGGAT
jgi:Glutaredoxin-like domain (DUF836)